MGRLLTLTATSLIVLLITACAPDIEFSSELLLTVNEDGSAVMEAGIGSAEVDENGAFSLDCSEIEATSVFGSSAYMEAGQRDDMLWCQIIAPFDDLEALKGQFAVDEEELMPIFQCIALQDGVFYLDMFLGQDADPESVDDGDFPFVVTFPGPIHSHNADLIEGNTLTWNLASPSILDHMRVNLLEDDLCPGQGVELRIRVHKDGTSQARLLIPLPPDPEGELVASMVQNLRQGYWQTSVSGDPAAGAVVQGQRFIAADRISASVERTPGIDGRLSDISLQIDDADPLAVQHELAITLNMEQFAEYWANLLPDTDTPALTLRLSSAGEIESASGDWTSQTDPLNLYWDPATRPSSLSGQVVYMFRPAPEEDTTPVAQEPLSTTNPLTVTTPATVTVVPTATQAVTVTSELTGVAPITVTQPMTTGMAAIKETAPGTAKAESSKASVSDDAETPNELSAESAFKTLSAFEVSIQERQTGPEQDSLTLIDSVYRRTDGWHGFDYGGVKLVFGPAGIEEYAYYLVDDREAWLDNGVWQNAARGLAPASPLQAAVDYNPYESLARDILTKPTWDNKGLDTYNGVPVHHLSLSQSTPAPAPYLGLFVTEAQIYMTEEEGYVVAYSMVLMDEESAAYPPDDDVLVVKIEYELNRPNEVQAIELPQRAAP